MRYGRRRNAWPPVSAALALEFAHETCQRFDCFTLNGVVE
jgi:hypothetical protein